MLPMRGTGRGRIIADDVAAGMSLNRERTISQS
jgi:hypothetical protein